MWMDDGGTPDEAPQGFAQPSLPPLVPYATASLTAPAGVPDAPPATFSVAGDPGPRLDQVAPAPPATRDPQEPFAAGQENQLPAGQEERDPRRPIVTDSFNGHGPDFAPPTGPPVVAAAVWAPPSGPPLAPSGSWGSRAPAPARPAAHPWDNGSVGAIARPETAQLPPAALPGGYSNYPAPAPAPGAYPPPPPGARPASDEDRTRAAYWTARSGLAKAGVVLKALPWPVLLILLCAVLLNNGWVTVWLLCLAWIICYSNAKVARSALQRCFQIAAAVYTLGWAFSVISQSFSQSDFAFDAYIVIGRWCCAILCVVLPVVVWRACERLPR